MLRRQAPICKQEASAPIADSRTGLSSLPAARCYAAGMTRYDLHTHSTASDGSLAPADLVAAAAAAGIDVLALTDHDCTDGFAAAVVAGDRYGVRVIAGVEISTSWQGRQIHVVGLDIDPHCSELRLGLSRLKSRRLERAAAMGERLSRQGIAGIGEAAQQRAGSGMVTRTHFAQVLFERGLAASPRDAFDRYLAQGKPGYVKTEWASLEEAVCWIGAAGGIAVIAHPLRYPLTGAWLRRLLAEFRELGGRAIEVASGTAPPGDVQAACAHALRHGLLASCGSDFHGPEQVWPKLGRLPPLPASVVPVWSTWSS